MSTIVVGAAVLASSIVYNSACVELEKAAENRLTEDVTLLVQLVQLRIEAELRKFEHWAAMPLVVQTALNYNDPDQAKAFKDYFFSVVKREPYSTVFIVNRAGDLVACDDPRLLYQPHVRKVVSKRSSVRAGFSGEANIGESLMSVARGRPIVTLTAPVWHDGRVEAILRSHIDMGRLRKELLGPLNKGPRKKFFLFDPSLPKALPKGQTPPAPSDLGPFLLPPAALRDAFARASGNVFRYQAQSGEHLAAASTMEHPAWVFFVSQSMSEILAPIRTLRNITIVVIAATLGILIGSILLLTAPTVRGIERCREFSANIRLGRLDHRLRIKSRDEVGLLAHDLNEMGRPNSAQP